MIILAPALELLFLGFGIIKFITRFYMSVVRNIIRKAKRISPKKKDGMFKLVWAINGKSLSLNHLNVAFEDLCRI